MALRPTCDVYLTAVEEVKRYEILVYEIDRETERQIDDTIPKPTRVDLCPRALERLKAKIIAGTTPPVERKKKDAATEADVSGQIMMCTEAEALKK